MKTQQPAEAHCNPHIIQVLDFIFRNDFFSYFQSTSTDRIGLFCTICLEAPHPSIYAWKMRRVRHAQIRRMASVLIWKGVIFLQQQRRF